MTGKDFQYIANTIDCEGFDYAFYGYSNFEDIKDEEFHKRRTAYLAARKELVDYIGFQE
jgi:hypothetical protein